MSLGRRHWEQDMVLLKWQLTVLAVVTSACLALYLAASFMNAQIQREIIANRSSFEGVFNELQQIEQAEATIRQYIDEFNIIEVQGVLMEEDRVTLLEDIRNIRIRHRLFPMEVQISEQERIVLPAIDEMEILNEQISLRHSVIRLQIPLLHEEDLTRFLADFLGTNRILTVESCSLTNSYVENSNQPALSERQVAICSVRWFTFRREPNEALGF